MSPSGANVQPKVCIQIRLDLWYVEKRKSIFLNIQHSEDSFVLKKFDSTAIITRCLSVLDFWNVNLGVYYKLEKKSISNHTWFYFQVRNWFLQATQAVKIKFELDKKSSLFRNRFFFRVSNWKKNQVTLDISKIKWR